jgi:hypothetical protein
MTAPAHQPRIDHWLAEKSVATLRRLTSMTRLLNRDAISRNDLLDLRDELYGAISYTATIVSASVEENGRPFGGDVAAAIMRDGETALEDFLYARGLISETTAMAEARQTCAILHATLLLLNGPRGENRTGICALLAGYGGRSPVVNAVINLTEAVTDGQLSWFDYCVRCRRLIGTHKCLEVTDDKDQYTSTDR